MYKENSGDRKVLNILWKYELGKFRWTLQHNKVITLKVLKDDVKYISKETFLKTCCPIL